MLLRKKKITRELIRMLDGWRHSGFNVFGERIQPREKKSLENLAAYLIRATFSQIRMDYSPEQATVLYRSKDGKEKKTYDALEWLAAMACHVPERGKQTIRYDGAYANFDLTLSQAAHPGAALPSDSPGSHNILYVFFLDVQ